ncbi:MAG: hypothetical protein QXK89_05525 [Candidatus Bathyarchaeia archaeon]
MLNGKYAHLVKPLPIRADPFPRVLMDSKDLEGIGVSFGRGIIRQSGFLRGDVRAHKHDCDEILFFLGMNPDDIGYLGAEVTIGIGDEEHTLTESSVVVLPKGILHGPFNFTKVEKPFMLCHLLLAPEYQVEIVSKETVKNENKYGYLIKSLKSAGIMRWSTGEAGHGPGNADQVVYFSSKNLEGIPLTFTWGVYSKPGSWSKPNAANALMAHMHTFDEILIFIGLNPDDINYLGALIEVNLGKERERYFFDKPTVLVFPKNVPHLPIINWWVEKPFGVFVIALHPSYSPTDKTTTQIIQ